uniref:Death domain-containing protein n=1 Tax=Amphimedon queenslandica TaxID=400682 RepID=A0A1X7T7J8_AMPQE
MIDVFQWRASIGLWNYCQAASSRPANGRHSHSFKAAVDSKSGSTTSGEKTSKLPAALSFIALLLLLFLSLFLLRHILMIPPTGNCYQVQCTTSVTVTDSNYLQSVILPGGSSSNLIYNDLYLIVCLRMLILLSGDVKLNPGPMIDDRPAISLLTQWLEPLVDWQLFGYCLPGITQHDVSIIEAESSSVNDQKRKLYSKWLSVSPEATWNDVITALTIRRENTLAQNIEKKIEGHPSVPNVTNAAAVSTTQKEKKLIMFTTKEDEKQVLRLIKLNKLFASLMVKVRTAFDEKEASDPKLLINLRRWIEAYMHWNDILTNASLDKTFIIIHPFYNFVDCRLIVDMSKVFLQEFKFSDDDKLNIVSKLNEYKEMADKLRFLAQVKHLHKSLQTIYEEHIPDTSNMPMISMKLHNQWHGSDINGLSLLIYNLLPVGHQQSIMKCITITSGSVDITLADSLIEYTEGKLQLMHFIGILSLYINDHQFLQQEDVNMSFTFELKTLRKATTAGKEFLIHLDQHTNEEGRTALMLACERGHEDIVHSLLSTGANVNIQDNKGWTALMMAGMYGHNLIINMLLQANANLHLKASDGSNALMIASYNGNYEVVELLISKGVDYKYQREADGWNAFMMACQNGHTQIMELLLKEQVDPNVQNELGWNAFMLACQYNHIQMAELLLKKHVDPNVQNKLGWNAFMFASQNGHTEIVKLLLKEEIDPIVQTKDGWNSFMLACQNGHTQIVELLLKEQVDPNVQDKDGWNAFILACENGHIQIVELLLKEQVDPNVQDIEGHTALMAASSNGHYEVVKLLLEWKADPTIKSINGYTAISLSKDSDINKLIYDYMYNKNKLADDA